MEQFERIRRDSRDEGLSIRALAKQSSGASAHGASGVGGRGAAGAEGAGAGGAGAGPACGSRSAAGWSRIWTAPRKQRHTARRVWQRLIEEEGAEVAESSVRNLVARLRVEVGADRCQVMVPQTHPPAEEAEVDFGEFRAVIAGMMMKLFMFCLRLSHSGKAVPRRLCQPGPGVVPGRARAGVRGVGRGADRDDPLRQPEPGGDPGRAGPGAVGEPAVRRAALPLRLRLVLLPARDRGGAREGRGGGRDRPVPAPAPDPGPARGVAGGAERRRWPPPTPATTPAGSAPGPRPSARPPPGSCRCCGRCRPRRSTWRWRCRAGSTPRPGSVCASPTTRCRPATPAAGSRSGSAPTTITVLDGTARWSPTHTRSLHKGSEDLVLDHYLEVLTRKPGALAGATALAAARACGRVHRRPINGSGTPPAAGSATGPGTRALIGVLLLHRTLPAAAVARRAWTPRSARAASTPTWSRSRPAAPTHHRTTGPGAAARRRPAAERRPPR